MTDYRYDGNTEQPPKEGAEDTEGRFYYPYIPDGDLVEVVNLAIALQRPLLLEGEPGCGKTRLASAVVYEFTQKYLKGQTDNNRRLKPYPFYTWNVKSTTRAQDGLYRYDAVRRLRDAQLVGSDLKRLSEYLGDEESRKLKADLRDRTRYCDLGPMGNALQPHDHPPVLLIDEVDKADSDFPNDLLLELEELRFSIPETGEEFPTPNPKPIIFITSNQDKPLPDPFLRRCLYYYVSFPDEKRLNEIIQQRFKDSDLEGKEKVVEEAVARFQEIREVMEVRPGSRPPGTSEFLEFLAALLQRPSAEEAMKDLVELENRLPLLGVLLKTRADQDFYLGEMS